MNLNTIAKKSYENAKKSYESGGKVNPGTDSMLKQCATEVLATMQAFNDWQMDLRFSPISMGVTDPDFVVDYKKYFEDALANIIYCCTIISGRHNLDIESALLRKVEQFTD